MNEYCYVIVNNGGYSWRVLSVADMSGPREPKTAALPDLLQEGWVPVRETPMGGGTSPVAHSLVLLEKNNKPKPASKAPRPPKG
jgi:hypothetical protein